MSFTIEYLFKPEIQRYLPTILCVNDIDMPMFVAASVGDDGGCEAGHHGRVCRSYCQVKI